MEGKRKIATISGLSTRVHDDPNLGTGLTASMIPDSALGARPNTPAHLWRSMSLHGLCERRSEGAPLVERGKVGDSSKAPPPPHLSTCQKTQPQAFKFWGPEIFFLYL